MSALFTLPFVPALSLAGAFSAGATLTFYLTDTTTAANVYADPALNTSLGNIVTADAYGRFVNIYLSEAVIYRVILADSTGAQIAEADGVAAVPTSAQTAITELQSEVAGKADAEAVGSARGVIAINVTATLTAAQVGNLIELGGGGSTLSTPSGATLSNGATFPIVNNGTSAWTLSASTGAFLGAGVGGFPTTFAIPVGASLVIQFDGTNWVITGAAVIPTGSVFYFAANAAPTGYLACDGSPVSRTTYAALFAVTGTAFGSGDGSTTFNLPDLRGEFIRGWDNGRGLDSGRAFGTTQADAFQGHGHENTYQETGGSGGTGEFLGANNTPGSVGNTGRVIDPTTLGAYGTPRISTETRPVNVALLPCIKV